MGGLGGDLGPLLARRRCLGDGGRQTGYGPARTRDVPALRPDGDFRAGRPASFERLWRLFPLTYVVNNLNRGLGLPDRYPFVLAPPAVAKLRFVHDTIAAARSD